MWKKFDIIFCMLLFLLFVAACTQIKISHSDTVEESLSSEIKYEIKSDTNTSDLIKDAQTEQEQNDSDNDNPDTVMDSVQEIPQDTAADLLKDDGELTLPDADVQPDVNTDNDIAEDSNFEDVVDIQNTDLADNIPEDQATDILQDQAEEMTGDFINDAAADVFDETPDNFDADVSTDAGCKPVTCKKLCKFGFKTDANGCEVCECRDCKLTKDCNPVMKCPDPICTAEGFCLCSCGSTEAKSYECPDGTLVPFCNCTVSGYNCLEHPEYQCPTVCHPGQKADYICPDGTVPWCSCSLPECFPQCSNIGGFYEGFYNSCSGNKIQIHPCAGCFAFCGAISTKSEGWYNSCTGELIEYASCAPIFDCIASPEKQCSSLSCLKDKTAKYACSDKSEVQFCECDVPDAKCPPKCQKLSVLTEGWYDSCTNQLIKLVKCLTCSVKCDLIGSKSEGWYSSCSGLIKYANCATGTWKCSANPWTQCKGISKCHDNGEQFDVTGDGFGMCCPGLSEIDVVQWTGNTCVPPNCECKACTFCGDGKCEIPENLCNCPKDCF
jgi:hypothetical protein